MYNTDLPRRADLPTSAQLLRSTLIAAASACVILLTVVLPSEYAIDPTGIGRMLGLTQMGEIKTQLAEEAAKDKAPPSTPPQASAQKLEEQPAPQRADGIEGLIFSQGQLSAGMTPPAEQSWPLPEAPPAISPPAAPPPAPPAIRQAERPPAAGRSDEISFTLAPGQGAEVKLVMRQGARANFVWASSGGPVNFDTHGDAPGKSTSYEKGRGVARDEGVLEAAFDGNHGWFWRNRGRADVTVTLQTRGDYTQFKRVL